MQASATLETKVCSIGDIVRSMAALGLTKPVEAAEGDNEAPRLWKAIEQQFGVRRSAPAITEQAASRPEGFIPKGGDPERPEKQNAVSGGHSFDDDEISSRPGPQRLGDLCAIDIPAARKSGETPAARRKAERTPPDPRLEDFTRQRALPRKRSHFSLLPPRIAGAILRELCSIAQPAGRLDIDRVISQLALGNTLPRQVPRKLIFRPARQVIVATHRTDRMQSFYQDFADVMALLKRATNATVIRRDWTKPAELLRLMREASLRASTQSLVLILSDLGYGAWRWTLGEYVWPAVYSNPIRQAKRDLAGVALLTPARQEHWRTSLFRGVAAVQWDHGSTAVQARRAAWGARSANPRQAPLRLHLPVDPTPRQLGLGALFCANLDIDRLRALRLAFYPHSSAEVEALAWHGPNFLRFGSHRLWVNHAALDADRRSVIRWHRLQATLEALRKEAAFGEALDEAWSAIEGIIGCSPALAAQRGSKGQEEPDEMTLEAWGQARRALAALLRDKRIMGALSDRHPEWHTMFDNLAHGIGAVIAEHARDLSRYFGPETEMDQFEEELLWEAWLEEDDPARPRTLRRLNQLLQELQGSDLSDSEQSIRARNWVRFRLPLQSLAIQTLPEARDLAAIASEMLGFLVPLAVPEGVEAPPEFRGYEAGPLISRMRRRDLYLRRRLGYVWLARLDRPPPARGGGAGAQELFRIRVPNVEALVLRFGNDADSQAFHIRSGEVAEIDWRGPPDLHLDLTGEVFQLNESAENDTTLAVWRTRIRTARRIGDWTAAGRWLRRARAIQPSLAADWLMAHAASISEEGVDAAKSALSARLGNPNLARHPARLAGVAVAAASLAEIDSELDDGVEILETALAQLREYPNLVARVRLNAFLVRLRLRQLQVQACDGPVASLQSDLARLSAQAHRRAFQHPLAEALWSLRRYAMEAGRPELGKLVYHAARAYSPDLKHNRENADPMPLTSADIETRFLLLSTAYHHEELFHPAQQALDTARILEELTFETGREDLFQSDSASIARTLYNNGKTNYAANIVRAGAQWALNRRSAWQLALIVAEGAYQREFIGAGDGHAETAWADEILPKAETSAFTTLVRVSASAVELCAERRHTKAFALLAEWVDIARQSGAVWREMLLLNMLTKFSREADNPEFLGAAFSRMVDLADLTGDTLGRANTLDQVAIFEAGQPRTDANSDTQRPSRTPGLDPSHLWTEAIKLCKALQVHDSIPLYAKQLAEYQREHGQADMAMETIEDAIAYGLATQVESFFGLGMAYLGKAELQRAAGDTKGTGKTLDELTGMIRAIDAEGRREGVSTVVRQGLYTVRAWLAADDGRWSESLDNCDAAILLANRTRAYALGSINVETLLLDILDQRALKRFEQQIEAGEKPITASPDGAPPPPGARMELKRRQMRKEQRQENWVQAARKAGHLLRRLICRGRNDEIPEIPANDLWYYGNAASKVQSRLAIWFLEAALDRADFDPKLDDRTKSRIRALAERARAFTEQ